MADGFSDPNLFAEFDRTPERTDKILITKFSDDLNNEQGKKISDVENVNSEDGVSFHLGPTATTDDLDLDENGEFCHGKKPTTESENKNTVIGRPILKRSGGFENGTNAEGIAKLHAELQTLRKECDRWRRQARILSTSKYGKQEEGPAIQVVYMNSSVASKHRSVIESFVAELIVRDRSDVDGSEERIRPSVRCLDKCAEESVTPDERLRQIRTSTVIGCGQMYRDFIVDSMGWCLISNNPAASDGWEGPEYEQIFNVALPEDEDDEDACPQRTKRPKQSCFNCDGNHNIKECKEPYNAAKVAQNKQKFHQNQKFPKSSSRYHLDDPKFSKFKAGRISDDLRRAMNLSDDQLPGYIYNMRQLGYPPGYIQAMTDNSSGLSMFDKHGQEVSLDGQTGEDGEVDAVSNTTPNVDVTKIIEYPGFNVPKGKGVRDEHRHYGKPDFSVRQSKEKMAKQLSAGNRGVKRMSTDNGPNNHKRNRQEDGSVDMEISDAGVSGRRRSQAGGIESDSMTLKELQLQKTMLQAQLVLSEGTEADVHVIDSCQCEDSFQAPLPPTPVRPPLPDGTPPVTPTTDTPSTSKQGVDSTPREALFKTPESTRLFRTPSTGGSLSVSLGTPISEDTRPNDKTKGLPDPEKFSDGIQQDIPFENLPGATGTFDRMMKLMKHLRGRQGSGS